MTMWLLALVLALGTASAQDGAPDDPAPKAAPTQGAPEAGDPALVPPPGPDLDAPSEPEAGTSEGAEPAEPEVPDDEAPALPEPEPRVDVQITPEPTIEPGDPAFVGPAQLDPPRLSFGERAPEAPLVERTPPTHLAPDRPLDEPPILPPAPSEGAAAAPSAAPAPAQPAAGVLETLSVASRALVPRIVLRGMGWGLVLSLLAALLWLLARAVQPVRERLAPAGALPTLASGLQHLLRIGSLFLLFGALAAIVPRNLEPALPIIVLAAAAAIGWSWRDLLPDLVAGLVIAAERRIVPGQWIATPNASGIVEQTTLRVTRIRDATGRHVALPNRTLLRDAVVTDRGRWPTLEIELLVPGAHAPSAVRRVIEDAVLVSPWAAPVPAQMIREEREPGRWRVRARILESRFADRFEGALREHVEEVLDSGSRLRG